jgi:hypothetical protein
VGGKFKVSNISLFLVKCSLFLSSLKSGGRVYLKAAAGYIFKEV